LAFPPLRDSDRGSGDKRPMTFIDVMEMRSIGASSISPDGLYVLYTVSTEETKKEVPADKPE
jgi:hypothetical protein